MAKKITTVYSYSFNSLTTKKADDKVFVCKISRKKKFIQAISYSEFKGLRANSVDLDEVAHDEPPHQHLSCLQIYLFSSLMLKELNHYWARGYKTFFMLNSIEH